MPFGVPDFHAFHIEQGLAYFYKNEFHTALVEFDQALQIKESAMARFDRAHALLAMGRYPEAWPDYAARYALFGDTIQMTDAGRRIRQSLPHWQGESGKCVVLLAEGGFGDTIMLLRFKRMLRRFAPLWVALDVPEPLRGLAGQIGPLGEAGDCWASLFDLPAIFDPFIPVPPYLAPPVSLVEHWRSKLGNGAARRIGICWSSNTSHVGEHAHQTRSIELMEFLELLPISGAVYSLQHHDRELAERLGVHAPAYLDFADVAAVASLMDVIVSIDTAALHVAGAIAHPHVFAILPWACTWRWLAAGRWYPKIKLCQAEQPNDWPSAFAKIKTEESSC